MILHLLVLAVILTADSVLGQFSRFRHQARHRRNNPRAGAVDDGVISRPILGSQAIPRILNRDSDIVADGRLRNPLQFRPAAARRMDEGSSRRLGDGSSVHFVPSTTVSFEPEFRHIDEVSADTEAAESQPRPVVFRNNRLSNPLQFKSSKSSGWSGQTVSTPAPEVTTTGTSGEHAALAHDEESVLKLVRAHPRRYIFWPGGDTSGVAEPYLNIQNIEDRGDGDRDQDVAEDRILLEDESDEDITQGPGEEQVILLSNNEQKEFIEIKEEPILLTPDFKLATSEHVEENDDDVGHHDDGENSQIVVTDARPSGHEMLLDKVINEPPMKIETFFGQLASKTLIDDRKSTQENISMKVIPIGTTTIATIRTTTQPSTTTTSSTTTTTKTTTTVSTTITTTTTTSSTTEEALRIESFFDRLKNAKSTTTPPVPKSPPTTTTTTKEALGIERFFGRLQNASNLALKSEKAGTAVGMTDDGAKDDINLHNDGGLEEVYLGTGAEKPDDASAGGLNGTILSRDPNLHQQAAVIETSSLNSAEENVTSSQIQNYVGTAEKQNNAATDTAESAPDLGEKEEIITTIQNLVEETTVFTITNKTRTVPDEDNNDSDEDTTTTTVSQDNTNEEDILTTAAPLDKEPVTVPRRLPSRYKNTRTRVPGTRPPPPPPPPPPTVINHNMNLQTALIINTLSKVLPNVPQSRLKNQPRLETVGSGVSFHQEEIFIFHTTLTELHAILDKSLRRGGLPSDLMVSIFAAKEHTVALAHLFWRLLLEAEYSEDKTVTISKQDSRDFAKHFHFLRAIFPFL